jgi:hypothetical protein
MTASRSQPVLEDLVHIVIHLDDPTLSERACRALDALLAAHNDTHRTGEMEWC